LYSEWAAKRREWLLHEAELFAHELLRKWRLGHCAEDVIILYSLHDGVVSDAYRPVVLNLFHCWDPLNATDVVWDPQVKIEKVCSPPEEID